MNEERKNFAGNRIGIDVKECDKFLYAAEPNFPIKMGTGEFLLTPYWRGDNIEDHYLFDIALTDDPDKNRVSVFTRSTNWGEETRFGLITH